jgi:methionyl-tRNA synthetase
MIDNEKISYADFAKLQIKIGTIVSVEVVPDADKLLKLMVDVGEETPRQIISGIREYINEPEELTGRQAPFLVNLAPRTIKGLVSDGMILAVGDETTFAFLEPHIQVTAGCPVR